MTSRSYPIRYTQLYIDGQDVDAASGLRFATINPATGETITQIARGADPDIDRAVRAARAAFTSWRWVNTEERATLLRRVADQIRAHAEELAYLEVVDSGWVHSTATVFAARAAAVFEYFAGAVDKVYGNTIPIRSDFFTYTLREPYGVVGGIVPWNAPLMAASLVIAPALAAGNTVVLKPAEESPLSALVLAHLCTEAGIPDGVVNVVPGYGEEAGAALSHHPDVDKISFTGSVEVGRLIMQGAAVNIKSLTLELGGKTPVLVFPDADLDEAVNQVAFSAFRHQGQICTAASRLLVHESIAADFTERLVAAADRLRVGDPFDPATQVGPLISARRKEAVMDYIAAGKAAGARLLTGGGAPADPALAGGYFLQPTVFADVDPASRIAQEEIFGPVLCLFPFRTEAEAVQLANGVVYGLGSSIWTTDVARAHRLTRQIDAGLVWVNSINLSHQAIPHGGFKHSGIGVENGMDAMLYSYSRSKMSWVKMGSMLPPATAPEK